MEESANRPPRRTLEGMVVMVTGASSGIGWELCLDLARAGCRVIAAARRTDRLRSLCEKINGPGPSEPSAVPIELDVTAEEPAIAASVQRAWDALGRIDALVNNAGIRCAVRSSLHWSEEEWNDNMRTNLSGLWLVSKHVCRRMRDAKRKGSVINITSVSGINPGGIAYIASKTAANTITKVMAALVLGAFNIRVNAIAPGLFHSEITARLTEKEWRNRVAERAVPLRTIWHDRSSVNIARALPAS